MFVGAFAPSGQPFGNREEQWLVEKMPPLLGFQHPVTTEGYHNMGHPGLSAMSIEKIPKTIN
jgi:hypothetical protein